MSVHGPLGVTPQTGALDLETSTLRARRATRRRLARGSRALPAQLAMLGLLAGGLLIAVAAAGTDTLLPESVRPVPSWLAGPFGATRIDIHTIGLVLALVLMFGCYVVVARGAHRLSARLVVTSIAALHALVLLAPPLLSTDIFSYAAYARMGTVYHVNPYLHGPYAIKLDSVFPYIGAKWSYTPTVYGPLFTGLSYLMAPLSIAASVLAYKSIAAVASLVVVVLVWNCARLRGVDPVKAVALVGLNPLIVVYGVGGGHNDLLMLAAMMAAVYFALQRRQRPAGMFMSAAAGIKLTAGLLLPFALADGGGRHSGRARRELLIATTLAGAGFAALGFALFGGGLLHMFSTLKQVQNEGDWHSIPGFIAYVVGIKKLSGGVGLALGVVFVAAFAWLLRRVWQGRLDWIAGAAWATGAILLTATSMLPWYVAWLIPLVALTGDHRLWRAALIMTGVIVGIQVAGYVPQIAAVLGI